jgi:hypothetical protein
MQRHSGQEVRNQTDEHIRKVSDFGVGLEAARAAAQQSVGRRCHDAPKGRRRSVQR